MMNQKEPLREKLKSHMMDIFVILLIVGVGFVIFQSRKHEKESSVKIPVNTIVNDFKNVNTR